MPAVNFKQDGHDIRVLEGPYLQDGEPTASAYEFATTLIGLLDQMRTFAAQKFLSIYNDTWREEEEPILDDREFCARLTNPSFVLYDEQGAATIYFDDSDMFAGHSIDVSVRDGQPKHASMVG